MQELSMHILDIAQNAIHAQASLIEITIDICDSHNHLNITVQDNGVGMSAETIRRVTDPFFTARTTRKVGLGIPFFKMAAEMTGGGVTIESVLGKGSAILATFMLDSIDRMPLGDISGTIAALMQCNPTIDFIFLLRCNACEFLSDSRDIKELLNGLSISTPQVALFLQEYIQENSDPIIKRSSYTL